MKVLSLLISSLFFYACSFAQKETFDIVSYMPPNGWVKSQKAGTITFTKENNKGEFCLITIYKSTAATANAQENFNLAWESLVKENLGITTAAVMQPGSTDNGWETKMGSAPFEKDGIKGAAILVGSSQLGKMVNLLTITNSNVFQTELETFLESVSLKKPESGKKQETQTQANQIVTNNSSYAFTTSNFDDGWVSVEKADWVEVSKNDLKVLIHYPKEGTRFPADPDVLTNAAWNSLVAPRYNNLKNYKTAYISDYNRPYLAMATVTNKETGQEKYVVLFNQGETGWIEFITANKSSFINAFQFDPETVNHNSEVNLLRPLSKMGSYNRFAVATSDLSGKWATNFSNNTHYVNIYTGNSAGMSTYTSSQEFEFFVAQKYKWHLVAANSFAGSTKVAQGKGDGNFKLLNNWQIQFTNMEGKTKTFDAYFSCTKGGRILWINDANAPGSGIFTGFARSKN